MYADLSLRLPSTTARWHAPEFRAELVEWLRPLLGEPTSLAPVRDRPWSTVWRVESSSGVHFAKQNTPLQAFEARLVSRLAELAPDDVVPVTAADPDRDLLLTPDQGPVLAEGVADHEQLLAAVSRVMVAAAQLQRALAPHDAVLAHAGLTALAPDDVLPYVQQRLDEISALPDGDPRAFEDGAAARLESALPRVAADVDAVASLGLPVTLNHNDLHTNNVFEHDGGLRFFDFGDAMLTEPLGVLRVPLAGLAHRLDCGFDDERLLHAVEPALEVWSDLVPMAELRAALPSSVRLAALARCESWLRCYASMTDAELAEHGDAAAYWLAWVAGD